MRPRVSLVLSLLAGIALITFLFAAIQVRAKKREAERDVEHRARLLAETLHSETADLLDEKSRSRLQLAVEGFGKRHGLAGAAVYDAQANTLAVAPPLRARPFSPATSTYFEEGQKFLHRYFLRTAGGGVAVFHDAGHLRAEGAALWRDSLLGALLQALLIALLTMLVVRYSFEGALARTVAWMRDLRAGNVSLRAGLPQAELFRPLKNELAHFVRSLEAAQAAAEQEARLREAGESQWTAERLRVHVRGRLRDSPLFVVSNREPYMHRRRGASLEVVVPASGLVTALEPVLRACQGTWIAHGAGDADRETVDRSDRLRVPPDEPRYTLRRVWLSREEEEGYYYGFANEGLWPLCHIAHTRPTFRTSDWERYLEVNRKFAKAVLEEMAGVEHPALLVQDYHFALLPRLVKEKRPDARVALFWHIPWPNPEAFGICPQQRELLDGLLGADLVGFHIQAHCLNFLQTVDRALESRIEWEHLAVSRHGHFTAVKPFPISVAFPESPPRRHQTGTGLQAHRRAPAERAAIFQRLGVDAIWLGVGVDRVDYTKGILERFRGVERFLEKHERYRGQFTFAQIGAPSRTEIPRYGDLLAEVQAEAERVNARFQTPKWKPIVLLTGHHSHQEIAPYYAAADLCLVTSLHDGMNLVAKEFVAARDDQQGVLILSQFTGASRELRDALIVNPYDTEQLADAIRQALEMDPEEKLSRMQNMRRLVKEHNIYRWAAELVSELSAVRVEDPVKTTAGMR